MCFQFSVFFQYETTRSIIDVAMLSSGSLGQMEKQNSMRANGLKHQITPSNNTGPIILVKHVKLSDFH